MADSKISALPASTTPLAGTEVLPIVQSSATKQVSVANLTAGRAISATQLTLTTGNLIVASGQGIDFSATSGTGTSELLNDYEEGDWTPVIIGSTTAGTGTYTSQSGTYTKIGRQVTIRGYVDWTAHTGTGALRISGLPFTIANDGVFAAFPMEYDNLTVPALSLAMVVTRPNQTYLQVDSFTTGASTQLGLTLDVAATLWFSATYFV